METEVEETEMEEEVRVLVAEFMALSPFHRAMFLILLGPLTIATGIFMLVMLPVALWRRWRRWRLDRQVRAVHVVPPLSAGESLPN